MHTKEQLLEYIYLMRRKPTPVKGTPGWLHYRVLCDYIREEIGSGRVSYKELRLLGELELLQIEFDCVDTAIDAGYDSFVVASLAMALSARIRTLGGHEVNSFETDHIEMFLEETRRAA